MANENLFEIKCPHCHAIATAYAEVIGTNGGTLQIISDVSTGGKEAPALDWDSLYVDLDLVYRCDNCDSDVCYDLEELKEYSTFQTKRLMVVVDMQNDFVTGSLGSEEAKSIVPNIVKRLEDYREREDYVYFTRDTHYDGNYLDTKEGKYLPLKHCIRYTDGWNIIPEFTNYVAGRECFNKETFGSTDLVRYLKEAFAGIPSVCEIELCGVCTDICVISNALMLKAAFPNKEFVVRANCCAGSTPEKHEAALKVLESCHFKVIRGDE